MPIGRQHALATFYYFSYYTLVSYPRYATIEKRIGETPLEATERLRVKLNIPANVPLSYAGRLDPMATGTLLILIGDECKKQANYHGLDKEYKVELLFGVRSDTGDVLGLTTACTQVTVEESAVRKALMETVGDITLPYPHFSSKTVHGKPLHTWAVEKRLDEIEIPTKTSTVYSLRFDSLRSIEKSELLNIVRTKIDSIAPVTDPRKHLGADFRRVDVRASWDVIEANDTHIYQVLTFTCKASSGTYMRSLAEHIAGKLGTYGLALSIHRTIIGKYHPLYGHFGFWTKKY